MRIKLPVKTFEYLPPGLADAYWDGNNEPIPPATIAHVLNHWSEVVGALQDYSEETGFLSVAMANRVRNALAAAEVTP